MKYEVTVNIAGYLMLYVESGTAVDAQEQVRDMMKDVLMGGVIEAFRKGPEAYGYTVSEVAPSIGTVTAHPVSDL